jgi:hypothetical protein
MSINKDDYIDFLEGLLKSLVGDYWKDLTFEDAKSLRLSKEGEQLNVLSSLSKIANDSFDGKTRIELNIFGDGTLECQQIHVSELKKGSWKKMKIRTPIPSSAYRITKEGMRTMLENLDNCSWFDTETQEVGAAWSEISDLKSKINDVLTILNRQLDVRVSSVILMCVDDDDRVVNKTLYTFIKELIDVLIGDDNHIVDGYIDET